MHLNKEWVKYLVAISAIGILIWILIQPTKGNHLSDEGELFSAEIIEELGKTTNDDTGYETTSIKYTAKITDARYKDQTIKVEDVFESSSPHIEAHVGDEVLLYLELDESETIVYNAYIVSYRRDRFIIYMIVIFTLLVVAIGRLKGLKALISLIVTAVLVLKVFLPRILMGQDPIILSVLIASGIAITTIVIISGFSKKSLTSILGTLAGVLVAGVLAYTFSSYAKLIGFSYEEVQLLSFIPQGTQFNFSGLLFASILLGTLGAVMDVSMSISSAIVEVKTANPGMGIKQLFQSGMNIGRDIMGTMVNTLVLAYTGSSLNVLILILAYNKPLVETINYDLIVVEIVRALAGTIGLVATIPITAFLAAYFNKLKKTTISSNNNHVER
ncbi:MAG: YibE/F family protein [Firmicutes bacterium HGW-Firmicutes-7]|nr:MAG: YibE/F family protein [Firmicutes bacterium HGW-Firmicutes-7]